MFIEEIHALARERMVVEVALSTAQKFVVLLLDNKLRACVTLHDASKKHGQAIIASSAYFINPKLLLQLYD